MPTMFETVSVTIPPPVVYETIQYPLLLVQQQATVPLAATVTLDASPIIIAENDDGSLTIQNGGADLAPLLVKENNDGSISIDDAAASTINNTTVNNSNICDECGEECDNDSCSSSSCSECGRDDEAGN